MDLQAVLSLAQQKLNTPSPKADWAAAQNGAMFTALRTIPQEALKKFNAPQVVQSVYKNTLGVPDNQYQAAVAQLSKQQLQPQQQKILENASITPFVGMTSPSEQFYGLTKTPFGKTVKFDPQTVREALDFVDQHFTGKGVQQDLEQAIPYTMQKAGATLPKTRGALANRAVALLDAIRQQNPNLLYAAQSLKH